MNTPTAARVANLPAKTSPGEIMETVLIRGDLSKLTVDERNTYYFRLCESVGLNPLTQPIEYISLNGKLRLYAKKDCTDQLRAIHKVSVTDMSEGEREGVYIVTCKVQNAEGRTDMAKGAVNIAGLKGEALANAMMKAETKSKRRATLSICGLGILDETEVDDIPKSQVRVPSPSDATAIEAPAEPAKHQKPREITPEANDTFPLWEARYIAALQGAMSLAELMEWDNLNDGPLGTISNKAPAVYSRIINQFEALKAKFKPDPISTGVPSAPAASFPGDKPMPRPAGYPDPSREPDAFLDFCSKRMARITSAEELELIFAEEIEPATEGIMRPDYAALQEMLAHHQRRLGAD
jgi:hypothetical protein